MLNGRKLWATNGAIADVVVVLAQVPRSEGHRGGITAFIVPSATDGVTVEARNEFMGLRGIENSLTRFNDVFVPKENVIGKEGQGLKIALTTLNTGRLALPAICAGVSKWATKIAREFAASACSGASRSASTTRSRRRSRSSPRTAFGLEAMLDVASRLADEKRNDIRIEAAIAKLYGSEMGWQVVDELIQVRGGRGYETAESLQARGQSGVPVEQVLRDMRINRIFEGSTEIMHLLIAREAIDQHLKVAGDLMDPDVALADKAKALRQGRRASTPTGTRASRSARGHDPRSYARVRRAGRAPALRRAHEPQARALHLLRDGPLAGRHREPRSLPRPDRRHRRRAVRDRRGRGLRPDGDPRAPRASSRDPRTGRTFCHQARRRADGCSTSCGTTTTTPNHRLALDVLKGRHTWLEADILDPSTGDGPMIPPPETDLGIPTPAPTPPPPEYDTHPATSYMTPHVQEQIPPQRMGQPDEIARVVRFLAEDDSSTIIGQIRGVNGGIDR